MNRAANVWDNSVSKSIFSSLKTERTTRKVFLTLGEACADVFRHVERIYTLRRGHSKLSHASHIEFIAAPDIQLA